MAPSSLGLPEGVTVGCPDGMAEIVGWEVIVGVPVGIEEGAVEDVGPELGVPVGLNVT